MPQIDASVAEQPACLTSVEPGILAIRYNFSGEPDSSHFEVSALVGAIDGEAHFVPEHQAYALPLSSAAIVKGQQNYVNYPRNGNNLRDGIQFAYGKDVLLHELLESETDIEAAVRQLTDNDTLQANNLNWQVSVLGFQNFRLMQRALYKATGDPELDKPRRPRQRERTYPEIRATAVNFICYYALDVFINMPPE